MKRSSSAVESFLKDIKKDHEKKNKHKPKQPPEQLQHKKLEVKGKEKKRKRRHDDKKEEKERDEDRARKEHRREKGDETTRVAKKPAVRTEETKHDVHHETKSNRQRSNSKNTSSKVTFAHQYILAPMVGASELAFRLLCRKYGAQLAYTPMMSAHEFAYNEQYRNDEFQLDLRTTTQDDNPLFDRPLVCHFSANTPQDFCAAAQVAEPFCDAIDLNLGCPQRTAYIGHYGSYLLDEKDRTLICDMIRAAANAVDIPIFCKIRLLPTIEETIQLCRQLAASGASLIAIHARHRASWERKGAGARDGPALLEQVVAIKQAMLQDDKDAIRNVLIVTNGNTITYDDVESNLESTRADGIMSAEGILDNPALFLPRLGTRQEADTIISIPATVSGHAAVANGNTTTSAHPHSATDKDESLNSDQTTREREKRARKLNKKLREIARIEKRMAKRSDASALDEEEQKKLQIKESIQQELRQLSMSSSSTETVATTKPTPSTSSSLSTNQSAASPAMTTTTTSLGALYKRSDDKMQLAMEYLDLATAYPVKMRSVIFHIRRMLKEPLTNYQLLEECLVAPSIDAIRRMIQKMQHYREYPDSFTFDQTKALQEKEALERKRREEGKRKEYEARMIRKAKREGKTGKDLFHYLLIGSTVPSGETVQQLRSLPRTKALTIWQEKDHAQHCVAFHLDPKGCTRGRTCAFLHVDISSESSSSACRNSFIEKDEVAG